MDGWIQVAVLDSGVIETRGEGDMTCALVEAWTHEFRAVRATRPAPALILFDALAVDGWESGGAAIALRTAREHAGRTAAAAFVTRSPMLVRVGALLIHMMPGAPRAVLGTRDEALAFLAEHAAQWRPARALRAR